MSIMEYNGGSVVAMKGKGCVAIASDKRLGAQALTVGMNFPKAFPVADKVYLGMAGLASDIQTFLAKMQLQANMYRLEEHRTLRPHVFANMVSSALYEKRFGPYFIEPIVAGLDASAQDKPFICAMDVIGCINHADDFVVAGTSAPNLYGMCESLFEPDMSPEQLFETVSQALMSAVDRDALSGWGAVVTLILPDRTITRELRARMD